MGDGDITVVGMVGETHLIEDIGVLVPRGVAVTIPGPMTLISKDLHRGISQRFLMRVYNAPSPLKIADGPSKEERERLETEIQRLKAQVQALEARNVVLEAQVDSLHLELGDAKAKDAKLDAILSAIQERPAVVQHVVQAGPVSASKPEVAETVDGDAPMFIPSVIKPEKVEERVAIQEETTSSSVSSAASKLKALRKGKS